MGIVSQLVARVRKSQPGSSSVHVNAPLGSEKDRVRKLDTDPALNNQGVELAVEALWPAELDEPLADVEKGGPGSGPRKGGGKTEDKKKDGDGRKEATAFGKDLAVGHQVTTTADGHHGTVRSMYSYGDKDYASVHFSAVDNPSLYHEGNSLPLEKQGQVGSYVRMENGLWTAKMGYRGKEGNDYLKARETVKKADDTVGARRRAERRQAVDNAVDNPGITSTVEKGGPGSGPRKGGGKDPERAHDTSETLDVGADGVADLTPEQEAMARSRFSDAARGDQGKNPATRSPEEHSAALHDREAATRARAESGGRGHELERAAFEAKYKSLGAGAENGIGHFHSGGHTRDEAKSKAVALRDGGTHATIWHVDGPKTGAKSSYAVAVPHKSSVSKGGPGSGPHKGGGSSGPGGKLPTSTDWKMQSYHNVDDTADHGEAAKSEFCAHCDKAIKNVVTVSHPEHGTHCVGEDCAAKILSGESREKMQGAAASDKRLAADVRTKYNGQKKNSGSTLNSPDVQSKLHAAFGDDGEGKQSEQSVKHAMRQHMRSEDREHRSDYKGWTEHLDDSIAHVKSKVKKSDEPRRVATVAIRVGDHLLMGQRRDNDKWTTPGGHLDPGEDFHTGALREALEETGIELDPDDVEPLTDVHELTDKEGAPLHVQPFHATLDERPSTSMQDDPDGEVYRWQWVDISDGLPEELRDELHTPLQYNVLMQALGLSDPAAADEDEPLKLDLGSGQARAPGHIGVDLYAFDDATLVHDVTMGLPFEDSSADSIRLVNALHDMDELSTDPAPLLAEVLRVLQPGGVFHYEGPHEITDFPDGLDETDHVESVVKEGDAPGWHQQTFERAATPDAATADDADPRLSVAQYDMLPSDAVLALDATANAWSDATSSARGNRVHGYPSQGALVAKSAAVDFVQRLLGRERTEVAEPDRFTHVAKIGLANRAKQIIYCVVLSPEESDQQEDFMLAEDIEIAAHRYMLNSRLVGSMHTKLIKGAAPVESYIAPFDMKWESGPYGPQTVKKGAWVVGLKIFDAAEWAKVEDGTYQSVSVSGIGLRDDMN